MFRANLYSYTGSNAQTVKYSSGTGSVSSLLCAVLLIFHALILCKAASAEEDRRMLDISRLPQNGILASDFVPAGWRIESTIRGDLNGDNKPDTVLTLIEALPAIVGDVPNERYRALVGLLQTATGKLQRVAVATRLLRCTTCYGMLAGPEGGEPDIKIIKGVVIIEELWGSRETVRVTLRFRYELASNRLVLIGKDIIRSDRVTGASSYESSNFLTGIKLTESKQYNAQQNRLTENPPQKQHIPKIKQFIEDVDYEELER